MSACRVSIRPFRRANSQYPNAQIEEVPDYNIFLPTGIILGSYVTYRRANHFPIKTYRKLETDAMNSLTNALSKIESGDGAVIQYVMRVAHASWRKEGYRIARAMQQGKKLTDVTGSMFGHVGKDLVKTIKPKDDHPPENLSSLSVRRRNGKRTEEKTAKAGLEVNIRVIVSAKTPEKAQRYLNDVLGAYGQFNIYEYGNSFVKNMPRFQSAMIRHFIYRHFDDRYRIVMNAEEMASLYHYPLPRQRRQRLIGS